jgi:hypothetical protein
MPGNHSAADVEVAADGQADAGEVAIGPNRVFDVPILVRNVGGGFCYARHGVLPSQALAGCS